MTSETQQISLEQLIETARSHKMTDAEREAQIRSFAYGNAHMSNPAITMEHIDHAMKELNAVDTIPTATHAEMLEALDYTSRYYLNISGAEFAAKVDAGEITLGDDTPGLSRVFAMLEISRR